jgi:hypothetical protein
VIAREIPAPTPLRGVTVASGFFKASKSSSSPDALGEVRNLPAGVATATFHPPVALARAVLDLQENQEHGGIGLGGEFALRRMPAGLRIELLQMEAELERELEQVLLQCRRCNRRVHWVSGLGPEPGHQTHMESVPNGHEPEFQNLPLRLWPGWLACPPLQAHNPCARTSLAGDAWQ